MCRSVSCPLGAKRSRSSWRIAPCAAARRNPWPSPVTAAAAAATCRKSRREIIVQLSSRCAGRGAKSLWSPSSPLPNGSLVHRAVSRHDIGDQVLDLFDGQEAVGAETRHVRTWDRSLGVVDPLVNGLHVRLGVPAGLAVLQQAWPKGAEAQLLLLELVAGIAVAAVLLARRIIGEAPPIAALRQLLSLPPVAHEIAVSRVLDGRLLAPDDGVGHIVGRGIAIDAAQPLCLVLHQARLPLREGLRPAALDGGVHPSEVLGPLGRPNAGKPSSQRDNCRNTDGDTSRPHGPAPTA